MELSPSSNPDNDQSARPSRRKSGRVSNAPDRFVTSSAPKRKRDEVEDVDGEDLDEGMEDVEDDEEDEPDEEEVREVKRKAKKTIGAKATTAKRPKTKDATTRLATRTKPKSKTAKKGANLRAAEDVGGLYAEVFAEGKNLDDVTAQWLTRFDENQAEALTEVVNLVLRATGSSGEVVSYDIEDPDECAARLTEIQTQLQNDKVTDYPLIAKNKSAAVFKRTLVAFFDSLIRSMGAKSVLYTTQELIENIHVWVSTMSSAKTRPFRHTATVISLAILSALAGEGKALVEKRATTLRQVEGEQKKQKKNQARIKDLQASAKQSADLEVQLKGIIQDWFDTVFVHRYRDVDAKVRTDCVSHLGEWIRVYPDHYFDGAHLRYLGWMLSDMSAPTRHEVLRQLHKIYRDEANVPALRMFTERFRPRMVEMATRDAEASVRVAAIELLDTLRAAGLLEPDDIDTVGKLIYDTDVRVRRTVVPFFVASIEDTFTAKIDELGGHETLDEALPAENEDDFESPRLDWLKLKSLAELLHSFDPEDEPPRTIERGPGGENDILVAAGTESRCTLAAQAILGKMDELKNWELLAGYLLFDHSQSSVDAAEDAETQFKQQCQLSDREEVVLLDVLNTCVKSALTNMTDSTAEIIGTSKKAAKKLTKAQQQEQMEDREAAAQKLAQLIPRLLKKYGGSADAASAVLRLEHVLNLDVFQELRQDSTTYSALLDDINKQFLTHENRQVLFEASDALRHARSFEELGEITESKLQSLWEDTTHALVGLCKGEDVDARNSIDPSVLREIESTVLRIANLARIADCTQALGTQRTSGVPGKRRKQHSETGVVPLDLLIDLITRGKLPNTSSQSQSQHNRELGITEDAVVEHAMQSVMFYFMWRVSQLHASTNDSNTASGQLDSTSLAELNTRRNTFVSKLDLILGSRHGIDPLRLAAAGTLLDLHNMFATLRNIQLPPATNLDDDSDFTSPQALLTQLSTPIPPQRQKALTRVFAAAERDFAKKGSHNLEPYIGTGDVEDYYSDEPEDDSEDEEDDEPAIDEQDEDAREKRAQAKATRKQRAALVAEERLCMLTSKIVIALRAGVLDVGEEGNLDNDNAEEMEDKQPGLMHKRITRNRKALGPNYKEIVAALEREGLERPVSGVAKARAAKAGAAKARQAQPAKSRRAPARGKGKKSREVVSDDEDEEEEEEDEPAEEDEEEEEEEEQEQEEVEGNAAEEEMEGVNGDGAGVGGVAGSEDVESVLGD